MKRVFQSYARIAAWVKVAPDWWARFGKPSLIAEDKEYGGGGWWFDEEHPAWRAGRLLRRPEKPAALIAGGCSDCGGKINAAQVKASPAAQEAFLRGD